MRALSPAKGVRGNHAQWTLLSAQNRAPSVEEKLCPNCGESKRAPLFYPNTVTPDGLSENCRSCCKVRP